MMTQKTEASLNSDVSRGSEASIWSDFVGHENVRDALKRMLSSGRTASTFLFVGPEGIGKRTLAHKWAQCLLCQRASEISLEACGRCSSCAQVQAGSHPDLHQIGRGGESSLKVKQFIGEGERRGREGLCHDISLKPFHAGRKVAIIDDADYLTIEAANCLLKTLEEPPPQSILVLLAAMEQRMLPTIRSRCQTVRFHPLAPEQVSRLLLRQGIVEDQAQADALGAIAGGSLERARLLADTDAVTFRTSLLQMLTQAAPQAAHWNQAVGDFVAGAGTDAKSKRVRLRLVLDLTIACYQQLQRQMQGAPVHGDPQLQQAVKAAAEHWRHRDPETAARCLIRCFQAIRELDANANIQGLVECWTNEMVRIVRGEMVEV